MIRLIYNGKVMTQYIQGCPATDELCQVDTFFQATTWATPAEALAQYPLNVPVSVNVRYSPCVPLIFLSYETVLRFCCQYRLGRKSSGLTSHNLNDYDIMCIKTCFSRM